MASDARHRCQPLKYHTYVICVSGGSKILPHILILQHIPQSVLTPNRLASLNTQMSGDRNSTGRSHSPIKFWGKAEWATFLKTLRIWIGAKQLEGE